MERQVDHYRSPCMGAIRTSGVCIAMTLSAQRRDDLSQPKVWPVSRGQMDKLRLWTIQSFVALLVLVSLVHPSPAFAANPDLESVLTGTRQRIEKLDYRVTGRLTRVEGNGKRTSYKFVAKAHWFPDGLRLLCEIAGPGSEKTSLLLYMSVSGHVTIEAVHPGEKAASTLPCQLWNNPRVGTDFS